MAGRHFFAELCARMTPAALAAAEAAAVQRDAEMDLAKVGRAMGMTTGRLWPIPTLIAVIALASVTPPFWLSSNFG
jgi:hypothetical protein